MATRFEEIQIEQIRANSANIREDLGDMEQLTSDVKTMGIKTPIIVYPHPEIEGDYLVQEGHRRRQAAIAAGLSSMPCNVVDPPKRGKREDLEVMLTTGRNHKTLTESEVNHGIHQLLDLGMDVTTVGKKFKMPRTEVNARAKLVEGPGELQKRFETGSLDLMAVQKIQELEEKGSEGVMDEVIEQLGHASIRYDQNSVNRVLERAKTVNESKLEIARLEKLGAVEMPDSGSGFKTVIVGMTDEEHAAAGHYFYRDKYASSTTWFEKSAAKSSTTTDAERAAKQRASRLNGLLGIAFRTRQKFLADQVRLKDGGAGQDADFEMLYEYVRADIMRLTPEFLAYVTGIGYPEGAAEYGAGYKIRKAWEEKVEKRLRTFTWRQLARMAALYGTKDTDKQLRFVKSFDRSGREAGSYWAPRARWLESVQRLFGYELDSAEVEAIEAAKDAAGKDRDKDYDLDTVTEACRDCRQSVVGGEGWDGRCGDCADRVEAVSEGAED